MSSFKRRTPDKRVPLPPGTRACPISTATLLVSSGIPSLDDILGGGVPLSCSLVVLSPDLHSAYGELVQKYFVAQGIASGHKVCVVHEDARSFVKESMWIPAANSKQSVDVVHEDDIQTEEKIKIAWRYEQLKIFETTVTNQSPDDFCETFDLTCRIPVSLIDKACNAKRLVLSNLVIDDDLSSSLDGLLKQMKHVLATTPSTEVVRICVTALGSPVPGEHGATDILRFLHSLRRLLRRHPHACALVTLAPQFCTDHWAGSGWTQKVSWVTDAAVSLSGFGANPALCALFPSHHGLVQIHKLPAPHSILPTSDKCSTLRGLSSSAAANIGTGENNLAFRCTRKRLVFETMHLDLEGGVTERRTTPLSTAIGSEVHTHVSDGGNTAGLASVRVELEAISADMKTRPLVGHQDTESGAGGTIPQKGKKAKKKVAFHSDKPDLYDF